MPDTDPNEFTAREKFILSYYLDRELSASRRLSTYDLVFVAGSVACVLVAAVRGDIALAIVGYALVVGRLCYNSAEGGRWTRDFQSIFRKFDAKLKAASEPRKDGETR